MLQGRYTGVDIKKVCHLYSMADLYVFLIIGSVSEFYCTDFDVGT